MKKWRWLFYNSDGFPRFWLFVVFMFAVFLLLTGPVSVFIAAWISYWHPEWSMRP